MKRYIDADALKEVCYKFAQDVSRSAMAFVQGQINAAPTIDAVEVVRCKDCIFWNTDKKGFSDECVCRQFSVLNVCDRYTLPTDFCSCGERREG